jgi:hypothetical protein
LPNATRSHLLIGVNPPKPLSVLLGLVALAATSFAQEKSANLTLAREVMTAMHADTMINGMLAQMKKLALQTASIPADATPEQRQKAEKLQTQIMELSMNAAKGMIAKMDQVYAEVYSEAELRAMKAFFVSPEGQSMLAKQPQVMARVMPLVQQMQQELMPQIQKLVAAAQAAPDAAKP